MSRVEKRLAEMDARVIDSNQSFVWRSTVNILAGLFAAGAGIAAAALYWIGPVKIGDQLGDAVFSGIVGGTVCWFGFSVGPLAKMNITKQGVVIVNPLRDIKIPWPSLKGAHVGMFGLRLDTPTSSFPVFVCQSSNAAGALQSELRPADRVGKALLNMRDQLLEAGLESEQCEARVTISWARTRWAGVIIAAYSVATFAHVYTVAK